MRAKLEETRERIEQDIRKFRELLEGAPAAHPQRSADPGLTVEAGRPLTARAV